MCWLAAMVAAAFFASAQALEAALADGAAVPAPIRPEIEAEASAAPTALPAASHPAAVREQRASDLNLPPHFVRMVANRAILDDYPRKFHQVEPGPGPSPIQPLRRRRANEELVRVALPNLAEPVLHYRQGQGNTPSPLRGFRAPILQHALETPALHFKPALAPQTHAEAAAIVTKKLAHQGLFATLLEVMDVLGPARFITNNPAAVAELWKIGFPVDWMKHFQIEEGISRSPRQMLSNLARRLAEGESVAALRSHLNSADFQFVKSGRDWRAAPESGENEIGMLRMQVGGGYEGGITPGDSIDLTSQLVAALPEADFLIAIRDDFVNHLSWLAQNCWPLRRRHHVTIIGEKTHVTPWAQDNGKAGFLHSDTPGLPQLATLVPRYASQGEDDSTFIPADSYLMDGLQTSGHRVIHSPLLFQGGNLLVVRDPAAGKRILLVGEAEIYRNAALGLTRDQVLEAFRVEFGVDECAVLPVVSHHLDYDVSVRTHGGQVIAFINDSSAAVQVILKRAIAALEEFGAVNSKEAEEIRRHLESGRKEESCRALFSAVRKALHGRDRFPARLAACFASDKADSPEGNFQCFLAALDILASSMPDNNDPPQSEFGRRYYQALRELDQAARRQAEVLKKLGWRIVRVPSLPDLDRTINYLNGIHDRARYFMPAFGGFYDVLDQAAKRAFEQALGPEVKIVRIFCAASQRNHGAVHCVASVYPRRTSDRTF